MKDTALRGLILKRFYDHRRDQGRFFQWTQDDFKALGEPGDFQPADVFRVCDQLLQHGLIEWNPARTRFGVTSGTGRITAFGVDVVEEQAKPPISMTLDQSISIRDSSNVQIGQGNVQDVSVQIGKLVSAIDHSSASDDQKSEAKSLLKKFLEHPLVASITGGLASTIKW